ncbi:Flp family type IVb pilin [Burkholderia ambifaria]|jgi:Flp pilus assembly pilin Flp|uniref:Flp/Fap pilin component n=1 Tax=Burkholderia ambifaria (strain MC40-6) TaxID=398577 RepID=B1Z3W5_BURA4|nr:Flp family type IVb pilin [Burkholderia ambifaria]ACB68428.1 Flp/Fap pilin component [Burkholderia ambifaria MC40-6]MBR8066143.1 Flp family type IVb pilin [Burkholderia ambifaria]MBR8177011.1 Flp family type IVb pilin [Burkholderia ambifaria]
MRARERAVSVLRWIGDDQGVTSIEYALIGALIATLVMASVMTLGGSLDDTYNMIASVVTDAVNTALGQ